MYHTDIELSSDRYELEQAYALECNTEYELEQTEQLKVVLERINRVLEAMGEVVPSSAPAAQTEEETAMFTEWLS